MSFISNLFKKILNSNSNYVYYKQEYEKLSALNENNDKSISTLKHENNVLNLENMKLSNEHENLLEIKTDLSEINHNLKSTKENHKGLLEKFITGRIDIKNFGKNNNITLLEKDDDKLQVSYPKWFKDEKGSGMVLQSKKGSLNIKCKCINDGTLKIELRGIDYRDKNKKRVPIYINYTNFSVNNKTIIKEDTLTCHDNEFSYKQKVSNEDIINIHVEWTPLNSKTAFE